MSGFRRVTALDDLWCGDLVAVTVDGVRLVLVRLDDDVVHAYLDRCAHLGAPLRDGRLEGTTLTCSLHHWQYDVATGCGVNPTGACLTRFASKVEGGDVWVDLEQRR
jgi:toluene monooxygenase system ferredoxin subunit